MFHVGGARSALYNWAFAHNAGGAFVLRVEDTDTARNRAEWIDGIIDALAAIGISAADPAFQGPYFQSHNADKHKAAAETLYAKGLAYYCDCSREQIVARAGSEHAGYDGFCRDRELTPAPGRALRFRVPNDGETVVVDVIRGVPSFPNASLEDFVIARGDGSPIFNLANVVDDIDERVTHVIRGEEHLSNTPKQQLLWRALGQEPPVWAHLPVLVNEQRRKLSKRRDRVALESYLDDGYLPDAMVNYLMLLGWGPRQGAEIQPYADLEAQFRLEDVTGSSAFFDVKKLTAINGEYIRALPAADFAAACARWLSEPHATWPAEAFDAELFAKVAPLAQTRLNVLSQITELVDFLFVDTVSYDPPAWAKAMTAEGLGVLRAARAELTEAAWRTDDIKVVMTAVGERHGLKLGKAQAPLRVAVTGRSVGLPLFETMELLGRLRVLERLDNALRHAETADTTT